MRASSPLPARSPLPPAPDVAFDRLAALVQRLLGVPAVLVSLVDRGGQTNPGQAGLPAPYDESRRLPLTHSLCQHVVRRAAPLIVADTRRDPRFADNLAVVQDGVGAYAGMPLVDAAGAVVGSLCALDSEARPWTDDQLSLLAEFASLCSAELQSRSVVVSARAAEDRANALLDLSETLSNTATTAEVSAAVGSLAVGRLGASFGGIAVLDRDRERLAYVDLDSLPASVRAGHRFVPLTRRTMTTTVVRTGEALFYDDVDRVHEDFPELAEVLVAIGARACAFMPLIVGERTVGAMSVWWPQPRIFDVAQRALLEGLARYTAQAVERATLVADRREVAETLQTAMLPSLPRVPRVELAGRYLPARAGDSVGGDWYDAFTLADGGLALTVGDVEGHDTRAAAVMGQVRASLRGLTVTGPGGPAEVLAALDRVLGTLPLGRYATGVLATLTELDGDAALAWSNAGHPPPLLIAPDRPVTFLEGSVSTPLGLVGHTPRRSVNEIALTAGSTLLLFTDGLVERRGQDLDDGLEALRASTERHRAEELDTLLDAVLRETIVGDHKDDVVLFGLRLPVGTAAVDAP